FSVAPATGAANSTSTSAITKRIVPSRLGVSAGCRAGWRVASQVPRQGARQSHASGLGGRPPARRLQQALERPAHGRERVAEQRPVASPRRRHDISASPGGPDLGLDAMPDVETMRHVDLQMAVRRMEEQMTAATGAAAATLRSFSDAPGRKVMLLLSGGWPQSPAEVLAGNASTELLDFWTDRENVFGRLSDAANRLGFTIYPVDVPDSTLGFGVVSAREQDALASEALGDDLRRGSQLRHTLELLASRTGGRPLIGSERGNVLTIVSGDTSSYYWLGFRPTWKEDDAAREIRVEVTKEGLRVRARSSFLDHSRQRSVSMLLDSALLFDQPPQGHTVPVKIGEKKKSRRGTAEVTISVAVPVDRVVFVPSGRQFVADLALHLALRDSDGRQSTDLAPIPFQVKLDKSPTPGAYVRYDTTIKVRNRPHRVVLAIQDQVGGATLTGVGEID
ncbi:MAG: hypothetical protein KY432_01780, partial [Acidobacteria bacterium]|nr:hypothetical protein [Acidobacteriota bacterium]